MAAKMGLVVCLLILHGGCKSPDIFTYRFIPTTENSTTNGQVPSTNVDGYISYANEIIPIVFNSYTSDARALQSIRNLAIGIKGANIDLESTSIKVLGRVVSGNQTCKPPKQFALANWAIDIPFIEHCSIYTENGSIFAYEVRERLTAECFLPPMQNIDLIKHENMRTNWRIIKDKNMIKDIYASVKNSDPFIRMWAIRLLGFCDDPLAIKTISDALGDPIPVCRYAAVHALYLMKDTKGIGLLIKALKDPNESVRILAANALRDYYDLRVITALINALNDKDGD